jgi:hypothetical protein
MTKAQAGKLTALLERAIMATERAHCDAVNAWARARHAGDTVVQELACSSADHAERAVAHLENALAYLGTIAAPAPPKNSTTRAKNRR